MKLGEILVKSGMLTPGELESALSSQALHGERLGSCLLESGALSADQISRALAAQMGVPPALEADFVRSDPELRRRLSSHQAAKFKAIPLFVTGNRRIAVAMANPSDQSIVEELSFILGSSVEPMVTAENVIFEQLERLYNMPRRRRTTNFQIRRNTGEWRGQPDGRTHHPEMQTNFEIVPMAMDTDSWSKEFLRPSLLEIDSDAFDKVRKPPLPIRLSPLVPRVENQHGAAPVEEMDNAACFTPTPIPLTSPPPQRIPSPPSRLPEQRATFAIPGANPERDIAVELILNAKDQQSASDHLFTFMRANFEVGAMFTVAGYFAEGRFGYAANSLCEAVEGVVFSLSLPSCFRIARSRRSMFKGPPAPDGLAVHKLLWTALGVPSPTEVLVCPVSVGGQITVLLYAQGKNGGLIDSVAANRMEHVCAALGDSLLRLAG